MAKLNYNFLNDIKVKHKLYIVYVFCVIAPIIVINLIFYIHMEANVKEIHENYYKLSTERIATLIERDLNFIISQANKIYMDQKLYEMLDRNYESNLDYVEAYYDYFHSYLYLNGESYQQINSMVVYTDNPSILHSAMVFKIDRMVREEEWFQKIINSPEKMHVFYGERENRPDNTVITPISIIQVLNQYQGIDRYLKILKIDLSAKTIMNILEVENPRGNIFIVENENNLLFSDNRLRKNQELPNFLEINQDRIVDSNVNTFFNWSIMNVMNREDLQIALKEPRNSIILLTLLSLFLSSLIMIFIYRSFYLRLNSLSEHVRKLDQEDFSKQYRGIQGKDEIGNLINAYNRMVRKIKILITDVYEAKLEQSHIRLEKKQAELSALQSQINPHYLFNTLESIRMKSIEKGEIKTAKIIKYLARSFRRIISYRQEFVTVSDEVANIKDFLKIQKYRFDSEFEYLLDIETQTKEIQIPKLIIQPFVENACIHGIERSEEKGKVLVKISIENKKLKCIIKDNGIGIEKEKLERILYGIKSDGIKGNNIGIENIYKRLKLYFKDNFDLKIKSEEGRGTIVILLIPLEV